MKVLSNEQEQHFTRLIRTLFPTPVFPHILGIMLLVCSQLTPAWNAAVLATSGATIKDGSTIDITVSRLKMWSQASVRSVTMKQSNVATSHLLTDVQDIWTLPRHRGSTRLSLQPFSEKENMSKKRMSGMISLRKKNKNEWTQLVLLVATTMNGMRTFHCMVSTWKNNLHFWKLQKQVPRQTW